MVDGLSVPVPEDFYNYIRDDEKDLPIEDKFRLYHLRRAKGLTNTHEARDVFAKAYEDIIAFLKQWVDIKEDQYHIIAVWLLGTYLHKQFNTFPFLFFNAMKGSGKTRLLKIISYLQFNGNGDLLNNASESVVFRTAQDTGLVFDEFESIGSKDKQTLREILNAAYKKGGKVKRMRKVFTKDGEDQKVQEFNLYTPLAMANIFGMDEVLEDRCITLILEKSTNQWITKKIEDFDINIKLLGIKSLLNDKLVSLCRVVTLKNTVEGWNNYINTKYNDIYTYTTLTTLNDITAQEQHDFYNKIDNINLSGRMLELMFPLLLISNFISSQLLEQTLRFAKSTSDNRKGEDLTESKDVMVLSFVASKTIDYSTSYHQLLELAREFKQYVGELEDNDYNWCNAKWLGRSLKRLSLIIDKKRINQGRMVKLDIMKAIEKLKMFKEDVIQ